MAALRHRIDSKSKDFLRAVRSYGDRATTTDIRQVTGLNQSEAQYRFKKLDELDLIEIGYGEQTHPRKNPPRVAILTGKARREIERGLLGEYDEDSQHRPSGNATADENEEVEELWQEVERMKERLNALTQAKGGTGNVDLDVGGDDEKPASSELAKEVSKLNQRLQELEASVGGLDGDVDIAQHPTLQGLDERLCKVEEDVNDLDAYVYEWTETAQTYLLAIRRVIEEKFDLKLRPYLDAVTTEKCGAKND